MNIDLLKKSIKKHEDLKLKPYYCPAGKLSIGYGRNLEDNGIFPREAEIMLENDLLNCKLNLVDKLPFFSSLDDVRQDVLIEMCYNMGLTSFLKFKKTLAYIEQNDFKSASLEMLNSKWHNDFIKYARSTKEEDLRSSILSKQLLKGSYV